MIIRSFNLDGKKNLENNFFLFYGKNEALKNEALDILIKDKSKISNYDEKEILDNENNFIENILSKSLFDPQKFFVIKRATDKILNIIEALKLKNLEDTSIIIISDNLEKKSKLRSFFEKDKKLVCVPFYPDDNQILSKLAYNFLKNRKISISSSNINLIINKCNGDRGALIRELQKIECYSNNGKKINSDNLSKLINLSENHSISELVDNCLAQNKNKIMNILNENNFNNEDCIAIIRFFIIKAKKLLVLSKKFESTKNIDLTISLAKPPIFWKEKEIIKKQIHKWKPENIKKLIYTLSKTELQIKKNVNTSINLITDFILSQSSSTTNN